MDEWTRWLRRRAAILLVLAGITWIAVLVLIITVHPDPGGGSPV